MDRAPVFVVDPSQCSGGHCGYCLNAASTKISVNLDISGLSLKDVLFQNTVYPVLYFSGTLDFTGKLLQGPPYGCSGISGTCFSGVTVLTGNLTACLDPACSTQLFQLDTPPNVGASSAVGIAFNSNGQFWRERES